MSDTVSSPGMGWCPDFPDFRDHTLSQGQASRQLSRLSSLAAARPAPTADLRSWCSPIEDQSKLGACTAHAGIGLVEYFECRATGKHLDASRLFLYKATRNLLHWTGDTGATLRATMKALALFGVPPEEYWPYHPAGFDLEPPAFCYAFAANYQALLYYRLDPPGTAKPALLNQLRTNLAAGLPAMFGFTVYSSYAQAAASGRIPYPAAGDAVAGGHAVMAVGYDDSLVIQHARPGSPATTGALLIRNSWGIGWGAAGYGWLPYAYLLNGQASDWWSLIKEEWIDTGLFN